MPKVIQDLPSSPVKILAIDTETTGLDSYHGCLPFFTTMCDGDCNQTWWDWEVDGTTRIPNIPVEELYEIQAEIDEADILVLQNAQFDHRMLEAAFKSKGLELSWDWSIVHDTTISAHLLASGQLKDLTTQAQIYLGLNIRPFEDAIDQAVLEARRLVRRKDFKAKYGDIRIAVEDMEEAPSNKKEPSKADMWLPKHLAVLLGYPEDHPWHTVLRDYSNADSAVTVELWKAHQRLISERKLAHIYHERKKLVGIAAQMQSRGITLNKPILDELRDEYSSEALECRAVCLGVAKSLNYDLVLPKGSVNNSLKRFVWTPEGLNLPVVKHAKKGKGGPSMDKGAIEEYLLRYPKGTKANLFFSRLSDLRKREVAVSYMDGYKQYYFPTEHPDWYLLHPSLNPAKNKTLRWSSNNPNEQNISKKEGFNLRRCFGPPPDREWWSCDAKNIELRIPAYEAGEQMMIELFERPDDPPYYGSNHLLIFHVLHPEKWEAAAGIVGPDKAGPYCKKEYASTWYQYTKNGNFAVQYGAVDLDDRPGTADLAYHVNGAQKKIMERFTKQAKLNQECIDFANAHGYVETIPDKTVDPYRGYPLQCAKNFKGKVKETIPLNYHVQGTAMWWMCMAMIRCTEFLNDYNSKRRESRQIHLIMQVHDELVFSCPRGASWRTNAPVIKELMRLMEYGGVGIGIPTPVSCEYHTENWSVGESVDIMAI